MGYLWFGFLFFMSLPMPAPTSASAQTDGVSVRIISAPPDGEGPDQLGPIKVRVQDAQKVCGEKFINCRVALFSQTDAFYPQPTLDHQLVDIDSSGLVEERIHLGHLYTALVVRADRYQAQPEKVWSLPIRFALAKDDALPGAETPDVEPALAALAPTVVSANLPVPGASPVASNPGYALANTEAEAGEQTTEPSSGWLGWIGNLIFGPVVMIIILILLMSLFLGLSGNLDGFCKALAFSLPRLIEVPARRLGDLIDTIRKTKSEKALEFIAAAICFPLAIGLAVANYYVVRFSLELFLTDFGSALTITAATFVVLKGAAGMLLHVLPRKVKFVIVPTLIAACVCGAYLAYSRAEAMQEDKKNASASALAPESGVMINGGVLGDLTTTAAPAPQPDSSPAGSWVAQLFSKEAAFVATLAVILDVFEIICVYGAFHLSAKLSALAIFWPLTLALTIVSEVVGFVKETQLMNVVAIMATSTLTALNTLIAGVARGIRDLSLAAADGAKKIAARMRESWRNLRHNIRHWKARSIISKGVLERLRIRESEKVDQLRIRRSEKGMEAIDLLIRAEDLRQSTRVMKQAEHKFNQSELSRDLWDREQMNKKLRDTATSALVTNLDKMASLATLIGDELMAEAGKRAPEYYEAKAAPLAEETTDTVAFQAKVLNKMGTSLNGFKANRD